MPYDRNLIHAIDVHDAEAAQRALGNGTDPNARTKEGAQVLHIAAWRGYSDIVALLIEAGADLNVCETTTGKTPLYLTQGLATIDLLINAGADVNARTKTRGDSPLQEPFLTISSMERLISAGADVNLKNELGWTPLHLHTSFSNSEAVSLLLTHGADVNAKNKKGKTALDIARWHDELEIAALLESHILKSCAGTKEKLEENGGLGL